MTPEISFTEILVEIKKYNPHASPDEISAGVITLLEKEILPRAMQYMSLPRFPSWSDLTIQKSGRQPKKRIGRPKRSLEKRRIALQNIERARQKLHWDGGTIPLPIYTYPDADSIISPPEINLSSAWKPLRPKKRETIPLEQRVDPYGVKLPLTKERFQIIFQKGFQAEILSDAVFEDVFSKIEKRIRELISSRNLELNIDVSFREDYEIPTWKKYIITIDFPPHIDFEDRTKIWTIFDLTIRNKIDELAKNADDAIKKYLNELNKKLFVHIEL